MRSLRSSGILNSIKCTRAVELTQKTETESTAPHSWYYYFATIIGHYLAVIIESLQCCGLHILKLTVQRQLALHLCG